MIGPDENVGRSPNPEERNVPVRYNNRVVGWLHIDNRGNIGMKIEDRMMSDFLYEAIHSGLATSFEMIWPNFKEGKHEPSSDQKSGG